MNVRCNYCGNSFNLSRDYIGQAVSEAQEKKQKYHSLECIKCRKTIKVPLKLMRRYAPNPAEDKG